MYTIQQEELFSLRELMEMSPECKYRLLFKDFNVGTVLHRINKKTHRGRPEELNTAAMIYALLIAKIERIPSVKDLIRRLKASVEFRITCRFRGSDAIPSAASFSRLFSKLADSGLIWALQDKHVQLAAAEGFMDPDTVCFDATHVEADEQSKRKKREDCANPQTEAPPELPLEIEVQPEQIPVDNPSKAFKRGRPSREEQERRQAEREAWEAEQPLFERKLEHMLPYSYEELAPLIPKHPTSSSKNGTNGKKMWWHGYKLHVMADCKSQYILTALFSSAHVHDGRMAIPLLKKFQRDYSYWNVKHALADAGYDFMAVYKQIRQGGAWPLIDYNERAKSPPTGFNEQFSPICKQGHAYVYDSFEAKGARLKFTKPQECGNCPFKDSDDCRKVIKVKAEQDLRRFTVPARASRSYEKLYDKRTTVERIFSYLKEGFGLGKSRLRGKRAEVDAALSVLSYTLCKYAVDFQRKQDKHEAA